MADELTQPEARDDTYLEEVERALGVDETRLGAVRLLNQKGRNSASKTLQARTRTTIRMN